MNIDDVEWDEQTMIELERDYEAFVDALYEYLYEGDEDALEGQPVSGFPYCGCNVCQVRETISFFVPRVIELYKAGKLTEVTATATVLTLMEVFAKDEEDSDGEA